ncbi:hypothetical protein M408DRAFT_170102 [Serendipita vermifera MAFF 305830]|uniref:Uncharacterized protein n=1 Tax=Serendipita vermifera MAFF 305830 TaxID=933852 RepID=A0A0C3AIL4_SERVB|nr:hypothetical protein M408DRAFT_170102 [Serendipita vermifera MAFF 305830]
MLSKVFSYSLEHICWPNNCQLVYPWSPINSAHCGRWIYSGKRIIQSHYKHALDAQRLDWLSYLPLSWLHAPS